MLRRFLLCAASSAALVGCSSPPADGEVGAADTLAARGDSIPADTTPAPPGRDTSAVVALDGEGLRFFMVPSGSARPLPFGTPAKDALDQVTTLLGSAATRGDNVDCGASLATWGNGLTMWFSGDEFVGWSVRDSSTLTTASGVGLGSTRKDLLDAYAATIERSSLGEEFTAGGVAGLLDGQGGGARITNMWAGHSCIAR